MSQLRGGVASPPLCGDDEREDEAAGVGGDGRHLGGDRGGRGRKGHVGENGGGRRSRDVACTGQNCVKLL